MVRLLLPFAFLYAGVMRVRNRMFDRGVLKQEHPGIPVISVGNLTVGGTGKTPLVEYVVRELQQRGRTVAVVSRGYRRRSKGVVVVSDGTSVLTDAAKGGDEPVQLAQKFRNAIVVVGERRVEAARRAVELGADVIVLDDGFQHRYIARDLDIVVVDSMQNPAADAVLPAGRLREPIAGLSRAHVVALSHADEGNPDDVENALRRYFRGPFIRYCYRIQHVLRASDGAVVSLEAVRRMRLVAMSGIGNHDGFVRQLHRQGFQTLGEMRFADHHLFTEIDVQTLEAYAGALEVDAIITTEKDVVRLRRDPGRKLFDAVPVFSVRIDVVILGGEQQLKESITHALGARHGHRHH